jgi:medium-chain acyl-[acyl-carrier-protein] hydrolase
MLLYCFPHAGGSGALFRPWAAAFGDTVEVNVMAYRPAGGTSPGPATVHGIAEFCVAQILAQRSAQRMARMSAQRPAELSVQLSAPSSAPSSAQGAIAALPPRVAFFGHSLGALVAFETVRMLRARGMPGPDTLFASGHVAPHLPSPGPQLHRMRGAQFWREIEDLGGTPTELLSRHDLRTLVESRLLAEFEAAETYRYLPGRPLDCDVVALAGDADRRAPAEGVSAWRLHTQGRFDLDVLPGEHFFVVDQQDPVLRRIRSTAAVAQPTR